MRPKQKDDEFAEMVRRIAIKYAKLVEGRIDAVETSLTGTDLRDIYDAIQMLGHITATMDRLNRNR